MGSERSTECLMGGNAEIREGSGRVDGRVGENRYWRG